MTEVKDRPRESRRLEPDFWRARRERRCKGCRRTFMPQARSELYCKACSEAGRGWANRKAKQTSNVSERAAEPRQHGSYFLRENVLVAKDRYKPFGECDQADLGAVADRQRRNAKGVFGETRRFALYRADTFSTLAVIMRSKGVAIVADLSTSEVTAVFREAQGLRASKGRKAA